MYKLYTEIEMSNVTRVKHIN